MFGSRSFTSQVLDATLPGDLARLHYKPKDDEPYDLVKLFADRFGVLLPLLDLLNHRPGAQVEWQARYHFVGLQILESYSSGQEICNNYGPRDNEALLLAYGFILDDNPFDHFGISIKAPPGSPLDMARKTWKQDLRQDAERRCFIFDVKHPQSTSAVALEVSLFSFDLLDSISILCANEREIQSMNMRNQSLMSFCLDKSPKFEDGRIILATLSQLLRECKTRAARLKSTDPSHITPGLRPTTVKQRHAKAYRDGQLEIVETAAALAEFVLKRAGSRETTDDEKVIGEVEDHLPPAAFKNLRTLVSRHNRRLTETHELLDYSTLTEMTQSPDRLRKCISELEQHQKSLSKHAGSTSTPAELEKSRLAAALSALYSEYSHGVSLPHRVSEWIKQLVEWYPVDPSSWAYVPDPGPWPPGEEPPPELMNLLAARAAMSPALPTESALKRWLRPERLCWGWNVMEEEKIVVPTAVPESAAGGSEDHNSIYIYWQRF
jgi:hypothetical protein